MLKNSRIVTSILLFFGTLIPLWYFFANLQKIEPGRIALALIVIMAIVLGLNLYARKFTKRAFKKIVSYSDRRYFVLVILIVLIVAGVACRLFFYTRFTYEPVSDPMTFFVSAQQIASGQGQVGNSYVAFQPYLSAYNNSLALAIKVIPQPWLATIVLNTTFDILGALALLAVLRVLLGAKSKVPIIGFAAWFLSPLNIIFSVISLPVIAVNFFVITAILAGCLLIKAIISKGGRKRDLIVLSLLFGTTTAIGNAFRPIFLVAYIALVLVVLFRFAVARKNYLLRRTGIAMLLAGIVFMTAQAINVRFVTNQTGLPAAKNPSGWSMYVGSSSSSGGEWRPYHNDEMQAICSASLAERNFDACHKQLRSLALDRYTENGLDDLFALLVQKSYHQAEEQGYFYNAEHSIVGYTASKTFKMISAYMTVYMAILFGFTALFMYLRAKSALDSDTEPIVVFSTLIMVGWFVSFLLVESAPRYSTVMYPIYTLLLLLNLVSWSSKKLPEAHARIRKSPDPRI
jgi:hypothetical protein